MNTANLAGQKQGLPLSSFPFRKELSDVAVKCKKQLIQQGRPTSLLKLPTAIQIVMIGCLTALALRQSDTVKDVVGILLQAATSFKDLGTILVATRVLIHSARSGKQQTLTLYHMKVTCLAFQVHQPSEGCLVFSTNTGSICDHCCAGRTNVAKNSVRRSCVDAFVMLLKSDEPWLLSQEDQLCRGLHELREAALAQETIKRRRTYVMNALRRHFRALISEVHAGSSLQGCTAKNSLLLTSAIPVALHTCNRFSTLQPTQH